METLKLNINKALFCLALSASFFFISCHQQNPKPVKANKPADSAAHAAYIPFQHFEFEANTGGSFSLPSGSKIEVSGKSFSGVGKVDMACNEALPDKSFIIQIDSAGKTISFAPEGGLRIYFNGNATINSESPLSISLLSQAYNPDMFAFYYDSANKVYVESAKCELVFQPKPKGEYAVPPKPVKYDTGKAHFDFDINLKDYPELKAYNGISWQYAGNDSATDPDKNRWTFSETWRNISLSPTSDPAVYKITFKNDRTSFVTYANPVFKEKDYVNALKVFNNSYTTYQKQLKKRLAKTGIKDIALDNLIYYKFGITRPGKWCIARHLLVGNK